MSIPLSKDGVFWTIQGEGLSLGLPTVFIRLAGCSVGCPECDTDYQVHERVDEREIVRRVINLLTPATKTVWVTGGEPTDHKLKPLFTLLKNAGLFVQLATSGIRDIGHDGREYLYDVCDFVSVSPHGKPSELKLNRGDQINLVPGLNGLQLRDWEGFDFSLFRRLLVTPIFGCQDSFEQCLDWASKHERFCIGIQAHKVWRMK